MKRTILILGFAGALAAAGCNRPGEKECREAVENIQELTQTEQADYGANKEAAVRSCRGNATKKSVRCMIEAKTLEDLAECEGDVARQLSGGSDEGGGGGSGEPAE